MDNCAKARSEDDSLVHGPSIKILFITPACTGSILSANLTDLLPHDYSQNLQIRQEIWEIGIRNAKRNQDHEKEGSDVHRHLVTLQQPQ